MTQLEQAIALRAAARGAWRDGWMRFIEEGLWREEQAEREEFYARQRQLDQIALDAIQSIAIHASKAKISPRELPALMGEHL